MHRNVFRLSSRFTSIPLASHPSASRTMSTSGASKLASAAASVASSSKPSTLRPWLNDTRNVNPNTYVSFPKLPAPSNSTVFAAPGMGPEESEAARSLLQYNHEVSVARGERGMVVEWSTRVEQDESPFGLDVIAGTSKRVL